MNIKNKLRELTIRNFYNVPDWIPIHPTDKMMAKYRQDFNNWAIKEYGLEDIYEIDLTKFDEDEEE